MTYTPIATITRTSTYIPEATPAGDVIIDSQTFHQVDGLTWFDDDGGHLVTCGCPSYDVPDACMYNNVAYQCEDYYDCQRMCAAINEQTGEKTCKGAIYESFRSFECYLTSNYPPVVNGSCGIEGDTLGPDYYNAGILDGWIS